MEEKKRANPLCVIILVLLALIYFVPVLMMLLGASLLAEGLLTLSVTLCAVKIIRDQRKDEIEID